jgi:hypothetical protein
LYQTSASNQTYWQVNVSGFNNFDPGRTDDHMLVNISQVMDVLHTIGVTV